MGDFFIPNYKERVIKMEWNVVTVLIAIAGLVGTVAVPLQKNTKAMTQLSERISHLVYRTDENEKELEAFKNKASERHKRIFERLDEDKIELIDHEGRITALENKGVK